MRFARIRRRTRTPPTPLPKPELESMTARLFSFNRLLFPNRLRIVVLAGLVYAALC